MPYDARHLFKAATGSFPTAGQSLRGALASVGPGNKAKADHLCTAWGFTDEPGAPGDITYPDNTTFNMTMSLTVGTLFVSNIQRQGNVVTRSFSGNPGASVSVSSSVTADTGNDVDVTVRGEYNPSHTPSVSGSANWAPGEPPTDLPGTARFAAAINNGAAGGGTADLSWTLHYVPDDGPFNPQLDRVQTARVNDRAWDLTFSDYELEWHTDGSFTDLHSTASTFDWEQSFVGEDKTYYLRYRRVGVGTWTEYGAVFFEDTRDIM